MGILSICNIEIGISVIAGLLTIVGYSLNDTNTSDISEYTKTMHSIHYYPSMLVIEKRVVQRPFTVSSGEITLLNNELDVKTKNSLHAIRRKL